MRKTAIATALGVVGLLLATAGAVHAQTMFADLQERVKPGDVVTIQDDSGRVTRGVLEAAGPSIRLSVDGTTREWFADNVREIRRRGDSIANGMKIGMLSGGVVGALFGAAIASLLQNEGHDAVGPFLGVMALGLGAGAGIGAGLDAAITGSTVVYRQPKRTTSIAPVVSHNGGGVRLAFTF